jgi:hypothetical protein
MISPASSVRFKKACGTLEGKYAKPPSCGWKIESADTDLEAALQHVDRFLLHVVDVQRGTAMRCHLDDE